MESLSIDKRNLLTQFGLKGSAIAAFKGGCEVQTEHLVDLQDQMNNDFIRAQEMVHFIGEFFSDTLEQAVLRQRLFMGLICENINETLRKRSDLSIYLIRRGDDIFCCTASGQKKLTVSIATSSPVSQLLDIGVNVDSSGAPVEAIGLRDLDIDPNQWTLDILNSFSNECSGVNWACSKLIYPYLEPSRR